MNDTHSETTIQCDICGQRFPASAITVTLTCLSVCLSCRQRLDEMPAHLRNEVERYCCGNVL
jgi:ribosome-binding protein aMBF1 (putative translation factor)